MNCIISNHFDREPAGAPVKFITDNNANIHSSFEEPAGANEEVNFHILIYDGYFAN